MAKLEAGTNFRVNAAAIATGTFFAFNGTVKTVHIGGGSGKVMDDAPKTLAFGEIIGFFKDGFL